MELNWLEDFLALADIESFSRAAETRHVTQPAFSRRIRALEIWAGAELFDRSTHRVRLTEAGRQFWPLAAEALRSIEQARNAAREAGTGESATLRFAATHALSFSFFPEWLRAIEQRSTVNSVRLISDSMQACEQVLLHGQAQFLLCYHHEAAPNQLDPGQFTSIRVGEDELVPAVVSGNQQSQPPYLAYSAESGLGRIIAATHGRDGQLPTRKPVLTSHLAAVLRSMVCAGRGMAWLPLSLIRDDLDQGRLVILGGPFQPIPIGIHLFRPRARQNAASEAFWKLLASPASLPAAHRG